MRPQLLQVLRLPSPRATQHGIANNQQLLPPGLSLIFPSCPTCTRKAVLQQAAEATATANVGSSSSSSVESKPWACRNCHVLLSESDINWTYRLSLSLAGTNHSMETSAIAFGSVADAWFGCSAAQWAGEVHRVVSALDNRRKGGAESLLEAMADQLAALMDSMGGLLGQWILVDLKRSASFYMRSGNSSSNSQYTISRIHSNKDDHSIAQSAGATLSVLMLWRRVAFEALAAATDAVGEKDGCGEVSALVETLQTEFTSLSIADALRHPSPIEITDTAWLDGDVENLQDVPIDGSMDCDLLMDAWESAETGSWSTAQLRISTGSRSSRSERVAEAPESMDLSDCEIDNLFEHSSQLFQPTYCSGDRIGGDDYGLASNEDPLSFSLFQESLRDEYLECLYLDSQMSDFATTPLKSASMPLVDGVYAHHQPILFDVTPVGRAAQSPPDTLLRRLESTPQSVAGDLLLRTPTMPSGTAAPRPSVLAAETPSSEKRKLVLDAPLVLAEETPADKSSNKRKRHPVAESPLRLRSQPHLRDLGAQKHTQLSTPSWRSSTSRDAWSSVPETPVANTRRCGPAKMQHPNLSYSGLRRQQQKHRGLGKRVGVQPESPRIKRRLPAAKSPSAVFVPETPALKARPLTLVRSTSTSTSTESHK
ncbi:hypothetical protein GQ54DRAFT_113050 [Martensiomyces pterosporus]|nr:hypothetical protein GQ54DRAFT_113050 [Martensiomyces pterosporus]